MKANLYVVKKKEQSRISNKEIFFLVGWVLWHINLCELFKVQSC